MMGYGGIGIDVNIPVENRCAEVGLQKQEMSIGGDRGGIGPGVSESAEAWASRSAASEKVERRIKEIAWKRATPGCTHAMEDDGAKRKNKSVVVPSG